MKIDLLLRRLHLYLGLALLPWFLMYGVSSIVFAHNSYFEQRDKAKNLPLWTLREQRPYNVAVPREPAALREFGRTLLRDLGLDRLNRPGLGVYFANPQTVNVVSFSFLQHTRLVYAIDQGQVRIEDRRFRFEQMLTGLHARGGFEQDGLLAKSWGVVVDVVCLAMLLWIATGFYMWWGVAGHRGWGWVAIAAGAGSFALFTLGL